MFLFWYLQNEPICKAIWWIRFFPLCYETSPKSGNFDRVGGVGRSKHNRISKKIAWLVLANGSNIILDKIVIRKKVCFLEHIRHWVIIRFNQDLTFHKHHLCRIHYLTLNPFHFKLYIHSILKLILLFTVTCWTMVKLITLNWLYSDIKQGKMSWLSSIDTSNFRV